jgi:hypothetical protein
MTCRSRSSILGPSRLTHKQTDSCLFLPLVDILLGLKARGFLLLPKRVVAPDSLRLGFWAECLTALPLSPEALVPAYPAVVRSRSFDDTNKSNQMPSLTPPGTAGLAPRVGSFSEVPASAKGVYGAASRVAS